MVRSHIMAASRFGSFSSVRASTLCHQAFSPRTPRAPYWSLASRVTAKYCVKKDNFPKYQTTCSSKRTTIFRSRRRSSAHVLLYKGRMRNPVYLYTLNKPTFSLDYCLRVRLPFLPLPFTPCQHIYKPNKYRNTQIKSYLAHLRCSMCVACRTPQKGKFLGSSGRSCLSIQIAT